MTSELQFYSVVGGGVISLGVIAFALCCYNLFKRNEKWLPIISSAMSLPILIMPYLWDSSHALRFEVLVGLPFTILYLWWFASLFAVPILFLCEIIAIFRCLNKKTPNLSFLIKWHLVALIIIGISGLVFFLKR